MKSLKFLAFVALFIGATTAASAQTGAPAKPRVNSKVKYVKPRAATTAETAPAPPPPATQSAPAPRAEAVPTPAAPPTEVMQARVKKMGKLEKKG